MSAIHDKLFQKHGFKPEPRGNYFRMESKSSNPWKIVRLCSMGRMKILVFERTGDDTGINRPVQYIYTASSLEDLGNYIASRVELIRDFDMENAESFV